MNFDVAERLKTDVLVIGAGGAGLRAAYEAKAAGARTLLVNKGRIGVSGATAVGLASSAGFAIPDGAGDPEDSPDVHYDDIITAAQGCADPALVRILVDEAVRAGEDMDRWNVEFIKDPASGKALIAQGDFASRPRNRKIYHHGKPVVDALKRQCEEIGVDFLERAMVLALLVSDDGVGGALVLGQDGRLTVVEAGATVVTTGGAGQLFRYSLMPPDITGDGYALAYRAGARMANMEFMQAGFGTIKPAQNIIMSWYWAVLPKLLDRNGHDVIAPHLPAAVTAEQAMADKSKHYPFSASDHSQWIEVAAKRGIEQGVATDEEGFHLDLREIDPSRLKAAGFQHLWKVSREWLLRKNMDIEKEPLHVGLFGHAINGGLIIDAHGQSSVAGLLAAGEAAAGPYGADRLGGNMLLNCQVFGRRAGEQAARVARERRRAPDEATVEAELAALRRRVEKGSAAIRDAHASIKRTMSKNALVVRNEAGLSEAEQVLREIGAQLREGHYAAGSTKEVFRLYEAENLVDVGLMMVGAARLRRETRGSHYRDDAPAIDPAWDRSILVTAGAEGPVFAPHSLGVDKAA